MNINKIAIAIAAAVCRDDTEIDAETTAYLDAYADAVAEAVAEAYPDASIECDMDWRAPATKISIDGDIDERDAVETVRAIMQHLWDNPSKWWHRELETDMSTTYTIATLNDIIIATVPTGGDIYAVVADEAERAGIEIDFRDLDVTEGVTLTDEAIDGDQIVFRTGPHTGCLMDEQGRQYALAVIRKGYE